MNRKTLAFVVLAVLLAALFVRLGFWQLRRLAERRARNAAVMTRLAAPISPIEELRDTLSFRRATVTGTPDFEHEVVYTGRSHNGSPGVYILTPLVFKPDSALAMTRANRPAAALVLRGWVYSPDAATVDVKRWRENRMTYTGYVSALPHQTSAPPKDRKVRVLDRMAVQGLMPYLLSPLYLVAQDSAGSDAPARLDAPRVDDGPHLSYAIQWFAFAAIALAGAVVVARHTQSVDRRQG